MAGATTDRGFHSVAWRRNRDTHRDQTGFVDLQALFRNPTVKEAVITPRGVRLIRQVAEGDRGAHLVLRQVRFPVEQVPADLIRTAIAEVQLLSETLTDAGADAMQTNAPALIEA